MKRASADVKRPIGPVLYTVSSDFAVRSENKAGRMYVAPHIIKKSPCLSGECPGIKCQYFPLYGFPGILKAVR